MSVIRDFKVLSEKSENFALPKEKQSERRLGVHRPHERMILEALTWSPLYSVLISTASNSTSSELSISSPFDSGTSISA